MKQNDAKQLNQSIQEEIQKLRPRSRRFFIFRAVGVYLLLGVMFFAALFLASFVWLSIEEFGTVGALFIILFLVLAFFAIKFLDRNTAHTYRVPRIITLLILLVVTIAGAMAIMQLSPSNPQLFHIFL